MGSVVQARPEGPSLLERLSALKSEVVHLEDMVVELVELTAGESALIWDDLEVAEGSGRLLDAYARLVLYGAHYPGGGRVFDSLVDVERIPARLLVPMGEIMLRLCDMGLDSGNAPGAPEGETSPIG